MPFAFVQSLVNFGRSTSTQHRRQVASRRQRPQSVAPGLESLEPRMALTVSTLVVPPPTIALAAASDTGIPGDGITKLSRPSFTGLAPVRSTVFVFADGQLLGMAKANVRGTWTLARPLSDGSHTITAHAVVASQVSSMTPDFRMSVDRTRPTASLVYDPTFQATPTGPVTGRVTLTFSEPVQGVSLAKIRFSAPALGFSVPLGSPMLKNYVGDIKTTQLSDRSYAFTPAVQAFEPGTYVLTFSKTGVVDAAGNPLAANAVTRFPIA